MSDPVVSHDPREAEKFGPGARPVLGHHPRSFVLSRHPIYHSFDSLHYYHPYTHRRYNTKLIGSWAEAVGSTRIHGFTRVSDPFPRHMTIHTLHPRH